MRPPQEPQGAGPSATPIYDALYAEWQRSFRTLPGDRHGEEPADPVFGGGRDGYGARAGYGERQQETAYPYTPWSGDGRVYGGGDRLPAALPPGPRRGL
ncbi:hypothetical protein [Streptomyces sp. NPDC060194]|uniref:hypothetical protein n=1 Tax=Streptomyces sp. NPDC060194 TaxID=3347069 RepID=UPI00364BDD1B